MPPLIDLDIFRILLIDYQWGPQIDLINLSLNLILSRILLKTGYNWAPAEILKPWIILSGTNHIWAVAKINAAAQIIEDRD